MATIQWYPGHMNKARNQLADKMNLIDVLVEVIDARIPIASRNPMISKLADGKPHVIILNKSDLADPVMTKRWQKEFQKQGKYVLVLDAQHNTNMGGVFSVVKKAAHEKIDKLKEKGVTNPSIRIAVAGIPNSGKSTLINRLVGRNVAIVGNKPGVTKGQNWLKATNDNIQILDTPGILWPKFEDPEVGLKLAAFGAIKDTVFHADDVALFVIRLLRKYYAKDLLKFSRVNDNEFEKLSDSDLLLKMTQNYGMQDDYGRFSLYFLQRLRKGKVGRISLDRV